jgi:hypothetical protein
MRLRMRSTEGPREEAVPASLRVRDLATSSARLHTVRYNCQGDEEQSSYSAESRIPAICAMIENDRRCPATAELHDRFPPVNP